MEQNFKVFLSAHLHTDSLNLKSLAMRHKARNDIARNINAFTKKAYLFFNLQQNNEGTFSHRYSFIYVPLY